MSVTQVDLVTEATRLVQAGRVGNCVCPLDRKCAKLVTLRHEASPKHWEEGDLVDLTALSSAMVYCDIVVTERVWTDLAKRAELSEKFGTTVLRDLDSLVPHIIGAAQAA